MVVLHEPAHEMRPRVVLDNPPQEQLRRLTLQMPNAKRTAYGSVDVFTRVDSRSSGSTYIVTDTPEEYRGHQTMLRAEYEEIARLQEEYIAGRPMIVIDGYISNAEEVQTAARLVIERANAAEIPVLRAQRGRVASHRHRYAEPSRPGLPERPLHRG